VKANETRTHAGKRAPEPQPGVTNVRYRDDRMGDAVRTPVMLQVFRYDAGSDTLRIVVGGALSPLPPADLIDRAREAMHLRSFVCHTITDYDDAVGDEFCFIPRGDRCEIMGIHTNGWRRHHGDHRRSLLDILNDLAAAVARGRLHFLDEQELEEERRRGEELIAHAVTDSTAVAMARNAADLALAEAVLGETARRGFILAVSEAATNMIVHGGGTGTIVLRKLGDRLRAVVTDRGRGLDFLNWTAPERSGGQVSMGYGYKIILENLEEVSLHTGNDGTTLMLDRAIPERAE
jgi:anti-sigma regulatory factor (Ser/Thr protein kinase)